jgi:hypothetical protein
MTEAQKIAEQIKTLSPPDKLRLAADLMENRRGRTAHLIIESVALELGAAIALLELDARPVQSDGEVK